MALALKEARLRAADYWRTQWAINPEFGVTVEDMLKPEYWAHVSAKLRPWDRIEARAEDGSYMVEFVVLDSAKTWAKVAIIGQPTYFKENVGPADVTVDDKYMAQWKGPARKWIVTRKADKATLKEELPTKADALRWISEHEKAM